ncbi:MAG: primosomal protein N' [Lachnospiraceae bacterium]|nr:primosomal protein N' [Lachnospiraceae bacterium]
MKYADIIVDISHERLDRPFQYRIPPALLEKVIPGVWVKIPFGKGNREIKGYVVSLSERPEIDPARIKDILDIAYGAEAPSAERQMVALAAWMKRHYGGTLIQSLKVVLPVRRAVRIKERKTLCLTVNADEALAKAEAFQKKRAVARARLLTALAENNEIDWALVRDKLNIGQSTVKDLEKLGLLCIKTEKVRRKSVFSPALKEFALNEAQQGIVDSFKRDYALGLRETYLIHGVTGSGKTEVYMEIISEVVRQGRQAIMLIPEIALTFQTVMRFISRFGDRVSYMHSKLSKGERYDQYMRAKEGELDIMIGPRSALFTPFPDLGIIVLDEEHEHSYKAENMPRYHAREVAIERARLSNAAVVLGSATPSVDSFFRAKRGEYRLFTLDKRAAGGVLPVTYVEDLRNELRKGNRSIFSMRLKAMMEDRLNNKQQAMLFLNRRGMAGFVSCRACGRVFKCPHCDVSLSAHRDKRLICHYCGYEEKLQEKCPECGSKYIGTMRAGTEKVEEEVKKLFPSARVLRMDADTTKSKDAYEKILSEFADQKADILVGTQMIVKGHDFPAVTLVGILAADLSLYAADYRAGERTFDLLTQAAGRAGRAELKGEVVIQTYSPEHYSIAAAKKQDYNVFYAEEIAFRKLMEYPPVSHLLKILIEDRSEERANRVAGEIRAVIPDDRDLKLIGPAPDSLAMLKDHYRRAIYVKHADYERLADVKDFIEAWRQGEGGMEASVQFDFDPL